jgi:hypothetical protein
MGKNLLKNYSRIIVLLIGIVIVVAAILSIVILLPIGPGLPPPDIREYRFIPGSPYGPAIPDGTLYLTHVGKSSCLLATSVPLGECLQAEYGVSGTAAKLSVNSWYFQERDAFLKANYELCNYLCTGGSTEPVSLQMKDSDNNDYILQVTRYSTDLFWGYFIIVEHPFLSSSDDFYILYYGINDDGINQNSEELVHNLMGFADLNTATGPLGGLDCEPC